MKILGNVSKKILESSNSYNYYKNNFKKLQKSVKKLEEELDSTNKNYKDLAKKVNALEKATNSTNRLFNTIFLDYELTPRPILQNFRDLSMEYVIFIDKICNKHNIEWMIEYGTILGAVRHDGFIPWDDDLDGAMMREDYYKFIDDIIEEELERNGLTDNVSISYKQRKVDGKKFNSFLQLFYKDNSSDKLNLTALDIFPYDYIKDYNGEDLGEYYEKVRYDVRIDKVNGLERDVIIEKYFDALNLSYEKQDYIISGVEGPAGPNRQSELKVFETDRIFPTKKINFNGVMLPGPREPDYYLKYIYKDYYMEIPKVLLFHNRMKKLRKTPNINEILERNILKLREVNKNFK